MGTLVLPLLLRPSLSLRFLDSSLDSQTGDAERILARFRGQ